MARMDKPYKVYISLPITDNDEVKQKARALELAQRIREKGFVPVNPFDIGADLERECKRRGDKAPGWREYMREDIYELLACDGILMDVDAKSSYGCSIELSIAQTMAASQKKRFTIYHTKEQWHDVNDKYII